MPSLKYSNGSSVIKDLTTVAYSDGSSILSSAKKVYLGSTLLWTEPSAETWIANISGNATLVAFTPTVNMSVASFTMILSGSTNFNYCYGIWTVSGGTATPVANACALNTTGITITNIGTSGANTKYQHTKTYSAGAYPVLTAGVTYYFHIGDRYQSYSMLSGAYAATGYVYDWAVSATAAITYVANAFGNVSLVVTAV